MRLPWYQIDEDAITKGRMLGRLLKVPEAQGIGICVELWRWALEISKEGDFLGLVPDAESIAAAVGWAVNGESDVRRLTTELQRIGLIATAPDLRVRGLERYRAAWEKNRRKGHGKDNGAESHTHPREPVRETAATRANPECKTETETEKKEAMSAVADVAPTTAVERIFEKYKVAAQSPRSRLDDKRRRLIRQRLEHFTEEDLCRALDGYAQSPHHHGQNDRNTRYVTLELWFRDTAHVEAGMAMAAGPPLAPAAIPKTTLDPYPKEFQ